MLPSNETAPRAPLVATRNGRRTLEFMPGDVQSEMRVDAPDALVLAYTRAIMCFALFVPNPRHILMVGLGGGSLAKFCYRHFPQARITVVELRADVIALRGQFCVPPDDARFTVVHADATAWLQSVRASVDVLVVDGFDDAGLPPALGSERFYGDCRRALVDGGVLVANIFSYDPAYPRMLERLRLVFDGRVCWFGGAAGNNRILFAVKAPRHGHAPRALRVQRLVERRLGLGAGWLNRLLVRAVVGWLAGRM
ncbi:fused MFS/spermidine synthase [Massilia cavernae]|uniref:Transferase spermidine synthase n=1 Tax=Massilia cavernae TaxID=2320864 RepID=A0A418X7Y9_9BURK|nr:fused MFS/spermidine synthase [Massilia cavernae]RJG08570.1 transferase spermidine synthase [Massilia cavernae]